MAWYILPNLVLFQVLLLLLDFLLGSEINYSRGGETLDHVHAGSFVESHGNLLYIQDGR